MPHYLSLLYFLFIFTKFTLLLCYLPILFGYMQTNLQTEQCNIETDRTIGKFRALIISFTGRKFLI